MGPIVDSFNGTVTTSDAVNCTPGRCFYHKKKGKGVKSSVRLGKAHEMVYLSVEYLRRWTSWEIERPASNGRLKTGTIMNSGFGVAITS